MNVFKECPGVITLNKGCGKPGKCAECNMTRHKLVMQGLHSCQLPHEQQKSFYRECDEAACRLSSRSKYITTIRLLFGYSGRLTQSREPYLSCRIQSGREKRQRPGGGKKRKRRKETRSQGTIIISSCLLHRFMQTSISAGSFSRACGRVQTLDVSLDAFIWPSQSSILPPIKAINLKFLFKLPFYKCNNKIFIKVNGKPIHLSHYDSWVLPLIAYVKLAFANVCITFVLAFFRVRLYKPQ